MWRQTMVIHGFSPPGSINVPSNPCKNPNGKSQPTNPIAMELPNQKKKPRILCLHGFRTSAEILSKQVRGQWPPTVLDKLDLVFLDGPFPAGGRSDVEGVFDPPYFEWYQANKDFTKYFNFEECLGYIEDYMIKHGPFDGLLGFSQGAILSGAFPGMQSAGVALTKVPSIKFVIIISGCPFPRYKFGMPKLAANAYSSPIKIPSLHFIGKRDFLNKGGLSLLEFYEDPVVLHHPYGHMVPRLDEKGEETMISFIAKIDKQQLRGRI